MRHCQFLFFAGLVLFFSGCGDTSKSEPNPTIPTSSTAVAPANQNPAPASAEQDDLPDEGALTEEQYVQRGMPATDRIWSGADMASASRILTQLAKEDPNALPRYRGRRSGTMFRRMTSAQNLELFQNNSLPIEVRFPQLIPYVEASNQIFKLYFAAAAQRKVGVGEVVELMGGLLRCGVTMLDAADEFLPSIKKDDPTYPVRMRGFDKMRIGQATMVAGCLQALSDLDAGDTNHIRRLILHMTETLPRLVPRLSNGSRDEVLLKISRLTTDPTMKDVQPELLKLNESVKSAVEKKKASEPSGK